ncbi:MAG: IS3 family transposase [Candidatus Tectimicrobiota bacterium]
MKYAWIQEQHAEFPVTSLCRILEVSCSGYYEWLGRPPSVQPDTDRQVEAKVKQYCAQGRGTYGTRRIKYLLVQEALRVSRRRIGRVLHQAGLRCQTWRKFKAPTAAGQAQTVAPNQLHRECTVPTPDTVYVGDITDLPTGEGWLYLAVVLDLYSWAVVGWSMANHMRAELVTQALAMATSSAPACSPWGPPWRHRQVRHAVPYRLPPPVDEGCNAGTLRVDLVSDSCFPW